MGFDLFTSRRNCNEKCFWWARQEDEEEAGLTGNELEYKRLPDGSFMAQEANAENTSKNVLGGVFMVDRTLVTIRSPDNLYNLQQQQLKGACYVKYQDEFWLVVDVQKKKARIQASEFGNDKHVSHYWYISMRR